MDKRRSTHFFNRFSECTQAIDILSFLMNSRENLRAGTYKHVAMLSRLYCVKIEQT